MHDFTAEELKLMKGSLCATNTWSPVKRLDELINKIDELIANYDSLDSIRARTDLHGGCNLSVLVLTVSDATQRTATTAYRLTNTTQEWKRLAWTQECREP